MSSPGDGTVAVVQTWPRFCSFQNSGANLTGTDTQVSVALRYCSQEHLSNSATTSVVLLSNILILLSIQFHYFFIYFV